MAAAKSWTEIAVPPAAVMAPPPPGTSIEREGYHSVVTSFDPDAPFRVSPAWADMTDVAPAEPNGPPFTVSDMDATYLLAKALLPRGTFPGRRAQVFFVGGTVVDVALDDPADFDGFARPHSNWRLPVHRMDEGPPRAKRYLIDLEDWWTAWLTKATEDERAAGHTALCALEWAGYPRAGNSESDADVVHYWTRADGGPASAFVCVRTRKCKEMAAASSDTISVVESFTPSWDIGKIAEAWTSAKAQQLMNSLATSGRERLRLDMMYPQIAAVDVYDCPAAT